MELYTRNNTNGKIRYDQQTKTEEFRCQVYEKPQFKMHLYHT